LCLDGIISDSVIINLHIFILLQMYATELILFINNALLAPRLIITEAAFTFQYKMDIVSFFFKKKLFFTNFKYTVCHWKPAVGKRYIN